MFFINELQNKYGELHWWDFNDRATYLYGATQNTAITNFVLKGSDSFFTSSSLFITYLQPIAGTSVSYPSGAIKDNIQYVGDPYQNDGVISLQSKYFEISVDPTQCGTTSSVDFQVLVSITDQSIRGTSSGGYIYSPVGDDIKFWSNPIFSSALNWEIESYDPSIGSLVSWVKLPLISPTFSTVFYMTYGNQGYTIFGGGPVGSTWDSQYNEVWHFSNTIDNSTSIGGNGTYSGITFETSVIGKGVSVPAGQMIDVPYNSASDITTKISISAWVFIDSYNPNTSLIVQKRDTSFIFGEMDWGFWIMNDGKLLLEFYNSSLVNHFGSASVPTGQWTHVAVSIDETSPSNKISFYINGVLDSSPPYPSNFFTSSQPIQIGNYSSSSYNIIGKLDEVRISSDSFSGDRFLSEYNNVTNPGSPTTAGFLTYSSDRFFQYGFIPNDINFPLSNSAVSIGCWFRLSDNISGNIVGIGGTNSGEAFTIKYDSTSSYLVVDMNGGVGSNILFPWDNRWHFIMATIPSTSNQSLINFYLDGATMSITQYGTPTVLNLPTSDFFIGTKPYENGQNFFGDIKFPMLFDRQLDFSEYESFFNSTKSNLYEYKGPTFKLINESPHKLGYLDFGDFISDGILSPMSVTSSSSRSLFLTYNPTIPSNLTDVMLYMIGDFDFSKVLRIFRSTNYSNSICIDNYNSTVILNDTNGNNETTVLVIREINNGIRNIQIFNSSQYNQSQSLTTDGNNLSPAVEGYVWFGSEPISNPLNPTNGQNFSNTIIKELIMVPTYLSDKEVNEVVFYLKNKWKI